VLKISEREQRRIGDDLHDGLGQHLTAIELMCASLHNDLPQDRSDLKEQVVQMSAFLREAIRQTRTLAHGLMGFRLTSHGLATALTQLAESISMLGRVQCRFDCPTPVSFSDATVVGHLYRIAQEAVHNAIKHAQARQVTILLAVQGDTLCLQISDNGKGLPQPLPRNPGMGLQVMRHRATVIGAHLNLESIPGQGVCVRCTWRRKDSVTSPGRKRQTTRRLRSDDPSGSLPNKS
jgi:signal transduction histidine kinase